MNPETRKVIYRSVIKPSKDELNPNKIMMRKYDISYTNLELISYSEVVDINRRKLPEVDPEEIIGKFLLINMIRIKYYIDHRL